MVLLRAVVEAEALRADRAVDEVPIRERGLQLRAALVEQNLYGVRDAACPISTG